MNLPRLFPGCALVALASCQDSGPAGPSPSGPKPEGPALARLELTLPAVLDASLGLVVEATVVAVNSEGQVVDLPPDTRLQLVGSEPYFDGGMVAEAVGSGPTAGLRTISPGVVTVLAVAGGVQSPPVVVDVAPAHPVVGQLAPRYVSPGDHATLSGYRMDLLDSVVLRASGEPLTILERNQAFLTIEVPDLGVPNMGCDPASWVPIDVAGIPVHGPHPMLRYGVGDLVQLEPGAYRLLGDHDAGCLSFRGPTAADYTLLYVDVRPIREAETGPEGMTQNWLFGLLQLSVADRTLSYAAHGGLRDRVLSANRAPAPAATWEDHVVLREAPSLAALSVPNDYLGFIDRPLSLGERVSVDVESNGDYETARVLQLYGAADEVVLLGLELEGASTAVVGRSFGLDQPLALLATHGLPVMQALSPGFPSTYRTGQVIVLVRAYRGGFPGVAIATGGTSPNHRPEGFALWQPYQTVDWTSGGPEDNPHGVVHEAVHLAQISRDYEACVADPAAACGGVWGGTWAVEGGADFLAHEAIRRANGHGFTANTPAAQVLQSAGGTWYGFLENTPTYSFGSGYGYAEWFMRDLMQRLVRAGVAEDEALAIVARATYEPWYGWISRQYWDPVDRQVKWTAPSQPVPGLVSRIREVLGVEWDPIEAILIGAVTQAVDDRNPNPVLQDLMVGGASSLYWGPFLSVRLGSGASVSIETRSWTWGWADIEVPAEGGDLSFSSPAPGVEWILVRRR